MPIEREYLHRQIEKRARRARDHGDIPDFRPAVRPSDAEDPRGHDSHAVFLDITDEQLIGIDAFLGTMTV